MLEETFKQNEKEIIEKIKEKLQYTIDFQYRTIEGDTIVTILNDKELEEIEQIVDYATNKELFNLVKIYHEELKRLRKDIKEIIEDE